MALDLERCIGCQACSVACKVENSVSLGSFRTKVYYYDSVSKVADKCDFCSRRVDADLEPACVEVCPADVFKFSDLNDPASRISIFLKRNEKELSVLKPQEKFMLLGLHVAAILYHVFLREENLVKAMITGDKPVAVDVAYDAAHETAPDTAAADDSSPMRLIAAVALLAAAVAVYCLVKL